MSGGGQYSITLNYKYGCCRHEFEDRVESQKQIKMFLDDIFGVLGKETLVFEDFTKIIQEVTSEMFLSVELALFIFTFYYR